MTAPAEPGGADPSDPGAHRDPGDAAGPAVDDAADAAVDDPADPAGAASDPLAVAGVRDGVLVRERRGPVLVARLNRPYAANALTPELMAALGATVVLAESDPSVRSLVVTGAGTRAFCAGMDLQAFAAGRAMGFDGTRSSDGFRRLQDGAATVPTVAAVNGPAVAGGFELVLGCDLVVAADTARFALPEVQRGLMPGGGGTFLGERIPWAVALELTLTGDPVDAERAHQLGLVNVVVPAGQVLARALALAERIAANAPLGVAAVHELVRLAVRDRHRAEDRLGEWRRVVFESADASEGAAAFVQRRAPLWQGR